MNKRDRSLHGVRRSSLGGRYNVGYGSLRSRISISQVNRAIRRAAQRVGKIPQRCCGRSLIA